jgi:hypothetical protein
VALDSLWRDLLDEAAPYLQNLIRVTTYFIRVSVLRRKELSRFSLPIQPLGELIDMCHTHEATSRHDKIFALFSMSSDDPGVTGLLPDYLIPWGILFRQLVVLLLGEEVSVKTWDDIEMAVIQGNGLILGKVSSGGKTDHKGRQHVVIIPKDASGHLGLERSWTLHLSAKSVQAGDLVCLLRGAPRPIIIRPCLDFFSVVLITAPLEGIGTENGQPHDLVLVWDWERLRGDMEYETVLQNRVPEHSEIIYLDKTTRLWNTSLILADAEEYGEAAERLKEVVDSYERKFGEKDPRTLACKDKLALLYKNMEQWGETKDQGDKKRDATIDIQSSGATTAQPKIMLFDMEDGAKDLT